MKRTSLRFGTCRMTQGASVSKVAAISGSTAFLAPLIVTSPCKGVPPLMSKLSMKSILARDYDSWGLSVIPGDLFDNPVFHLENLSHVFALVVAKFQHD